jgi:hypothetical protein
VGLRQWGSELKVIGIVSRQVAGARLTKLGWNCARFDGWSGCICARVGRLCCRTTLGAFRFDGRPRCVCNGDCLIRAPLVLARGLKLQRGGPGQLNRLFWAVGIVSGVDPKS